MDMTGMGLHSFIKSLLDKQLNLPYMGCPLVLLDIGARGGIQWPWTRMDVKDLHLILVEPDKKEAELLKLNSNVTVLDYALWHKDDDVEIHINKSPGTSSIYPVNSSVVSQFPHSSRFEPDFTVEVEAKALDGLAEIQKLRDIDFAKIDVQGAELDILRGGKRFLADNLVGLEVEVEFLELYKKQPLFADVDLFVRSEINLDLWGLRSNYWKYTDSDKNVFNTRGRIIHGDALYLRAPEKLSQWLSTMPLEKAKEKLLKAITAALAYGYFDYVNKILSIQDLSDFLSENDINSINNAIKSQGRGFRPFKKGNSALYYFFDGLAKAFKPVYNGWSTGDFGLGSRKQGPFWR